MTGLLVVAHEAQRNGATRVLLDLLPGLVAAMEGPLEVRALIGGPLQRELTALQTASRPIEAPTAILLNSALALRALHDLPIGPRCIAYVHEVGEALGSLHPSDRALLATRLDHVVCVSERSRRDLVKLGVNPERISVLPPPVSRAQPEPDEVVAAGTAARFSPQHRLIVGCGEATWRKGADLFVQLSRTLRHRSDLDFVWIGRRHRSYARLLDSDVRLAQVGDRLRWLGEQTDAMPTLAAADLLVLPSREDPQPLVPLEAAIVDTPTVGFAGTGLDDLVAVNGALAVPYPDVEALAAAVEDVLATPSLRNGLVAAAASMAADRSTERTVRALRMHLGLAEGSGRIG